MSFVRCVLWDFMMLVILCSICECLWGSMCGYGFLLNVCFVVVMVSLMLVFLFVDVVV